MQVRLIFQGKTKKLRLEPNETDFERFEERVRVLFRKQNKNILLYYLDSDEERIVLLEDADLRAMFRECTQPSIFVVLADEVLDDQVNVGLLKRSLLIRLKRKHAKGTTRAELERDLAALHDRLLHTHLSLYDVENTIRHFRMSVGFCRMDGLMGDEMSQAAIGNANKPYISRNSDLSLSSIAEPNTKSQFDDMPLPPIEPSTTSGLLRLNDELDTVVVRSDGKEESVDYVEELDLDTQRSSNIPVSLRASNGYRLEQDRPLKRSLKLNRNSMGVKRKRKSVVLSKITGFYGALKKTFFPGA